MKFRVTDERAWAREFMAETSAALAAGVRRAWDDRIGESPLARPGVAGEIGSVHPALAFRVRSTWIDLWIEERMRRATPSSDVRSWQAQVGLWRHQARVELGADEQASPLRLHVWAPGDDGLVSMWSAIAVRRPGRGWSCSPRAPRVARVVAPEQALELLDGAAAICEHARNLAGLCEHVGDAVRRAQHPPLRLVRATEKP